MYKNSDINCWPLKKLFYYFILWWSKGLSQEGVHSAAAQTREKEGKEEKEHKGAAESPGTKPGPNRDPNRVHGPDGRHAHPSPAERSTFVTSREDSYQNRLKDTKGKQSIGFWFLFFYKRDCCIFLAIRSVTSHVSVQVPKPSVSHPSVIQETGFCKEFVIGDLVWSKVGTYPWWPCMVSSDPQMKVHTRINTRGNGSLNFSKSTHYLGPVSKYFWAWVSVFLFCCAGHREYHVQFFGSVAERAWIHEKRIITYHGKQQFDDLQAETLRKASNPVEKHKVCSNMIFDDF